MASGKDGKVSRARNAAAAARLVQLLGAVVEPGDDDASAKVVAQAAKRHASRARQRGKNTRAATSEKGRTYLHDRPTRSRVLNAFLHEIGGEALVDEGVEVPDEHTLAPRLLEGARGYLAPLVAATGSAEVALRIATESVPITNELAARRFLRWAAGAAGGGALSAIADHYDKHRRRAGAPERDDLLAAAIMAAFAGRIIVYAQRLLGPHVRAEVKRSLERLTVEGRARARRQRARAPGPTNPPREVGTVTPRRTGSKGA
jgi:hypothetical protein